MEQKIREICASDIISEFPLLHLGSMPSISQFDIAIWIGF